MGMGPIKAKQGYKNTSTFLGQDRTGDVALSLNVTPKQRATFHRLRRVDVICKMRVEMVQSSWDVIAIIILVSMVVQLEDSNKRRVWEHIELHDVIGYTLLCWDASGMDKLMSAS